MILKLLITVPGKDQNLEKRKKHALTERQRSSRKSNVRSIPSVTDITFGKQELEKQMSFGHGKMDLQAAMVRP